MIYVPEYDNNTCCYMYDANTLRCYESVPTYNSIVNYRDYFVNSHYLYRDGATQFGSYNVNISCISHDKYTDAYFYSNDITSILLCFILISSFCYFIISKLLHALFKGHRR